MKKKDLKKLELQVLLSTMHQTDCIGLLKKMNIKTNAIVVNQSDQNNHTDFTHNGSHIVFITQKDRGVGLSRNTALMKADDGIALFADDDVVYKNDYDDLIKLEFEMHPRADAILFNVPSNNPDRQEYETKRFKRVRIYNCLRYGTFRLAVRVSPVRESNIYFSLLFGGGAKYSSGEDSLFIADCIRSGLKLYASPVTIGVVDHKNSTWFNGYTDKFFFDKGVFFKYFSPKLNRLMIVQYVVRKYYIYRNSRTRIEAYRQMVKGARTVN